MQMSSVTNVETKETHFGSFMHSLFSPSRHMGCIGRVTLQAVVSPCTHQEGDKCIAVCRGHSSGAVLWDAEACLVHGASRPTCPSTMDSSGKPEVECQLKRHRTMAAAIATTSVQADREACLRWPWTGYRDLRA